MLSITADELPRFMACNGSRLMAGETPPSSDTTSRDEGIAAHYMATCVISGNSTVEELVDRRAPNGVYMTAEMAEFVDMFHDALKRDSIAWSAVEHDTSFSDGELWSVGARADHLALCNTTLHVDDFKYGWRIAEPYMNWTLIAHAIGWLQQNPSNTITEFVFTIHQPRPYHPEGMSRSWKVDAHTLKNLAQRLYLALSAPNDELHTSNHCGKCRGLTSCGAARRAEMNAIEASEMVFSDTISDHDLAYVLDTLSRAQSVLKNANDAFTELAMHRIKTGRLIENFHIDQGFGHAKWKDHIDEGMLIALTGKKLTKSQLVTPAQAKKLGVDEQTIKGLSYRPTTALKLVRENTAKRAERLMKG